MTVLGIVHSFGTYNDQPYDNYNIHCSRPAREGNENENGTITEIIKVKASIFNESSVDLGDQIDVSYDRYGKVKEIIVF